MADQYTTKADVSDIAQSVVNSKIPTILAQAATGFKGTITPSSAAPAAGAFGAYFAPTNGVYTNFGGLTVNSANGYAIINYNPDGTFSLGYLTVDLSIYAKQSAVNASLSPLKEKFESNATLAFSSSKASNTSGNVYWIQDLQIVPANKRIQKILFPYNSTTPFKFFFATKSGTAFTKIAGSEFTVTPIVGDNIAYVDQTFTSDVYIGFYGGATMYYGPSGGTLLQFASMTDGTAVTPTQSFGGLFLNLQITYATGILTYATSQDITTVNAKLQTNTDAINGKYTSTEIANIVYDWKNTAQPGGAEKAFGDYIGNNTPALAGQYVDRFEFKSPYPATAYVIRVRVCQDTTTTVNSVTTTTRTTFKEITLSDYILTYDTTTSIVSQKLSLPIYIEKGQYLAVYVTNSITYTDGVTGETSGFYWNGTAYVISSLRLYLNYYSSSVNGLRDGLIKVTNKAKRLRRKIAKYYSFNFSQATTDWNLSGNSVTGGALILSTAGSKGILNKRYVSNRRIARFSVKLKADSVFRFGALFPQGNGLPTTSTVPETSFVVDATTSKMRINLVNGNTAITEATIPTIVADFNYILEAEINGLVTLLRLINPVTNAKTEIFFDYEAGQNYNLGAGNHSPHYFVEKVSGGDVSVLSLDIFGAFKPAVCFGIDSISDPDGISQRNYDELVGENSFGGDYSICAKPFASIAELIKSLDNEIAFMLPEKLVVMAGTNDPAPTLTQWQTVMSFCSNNKIDLFINHVVCKFDNTHIAKNALIDTLGVPGAKFDVVTALNNDPAQGVNPALYKEPTNQVHPNYTGHQLMADRLLADCPQLRTF